MELTETLQVDASATFKVRLYREIAEYFFVHARKALVQFIVTVGFAPDATVPLSLLPEILK
jgi:hypothetical protein